MSSKNPISNHLYLSDTENVLGRRMFSAKTMTVAHSNPISTGSCAKSLQSCLTLWTPWTRGRSLPGSSVHGTL